MPRFVHDCFTDPCLFFAFKLKDTRAAPLQRTQFKFIPRHPLSGRLETQPRLSPRDLDGFDDVTPHTSPPVDAGRGSPAAEQPAAPGPEQLEYAAVHTPTLTDSKCCRHPFVALEHEYGLTPVTKPKRRPCKDRMPSHLPPPACPPLPCSLLAGALKLSAMVHSYF